MLVNAETAEHAYTPFIPRENESKAITSVLLTVVDPIRVVLSTDTLMPFLVLRMSPFRVACKVNCPGLSTTHSIEKEALGCMLNLLPSPSIAVREECNAAKGGEVRSVIKVRDPVNRTQRVDSILQSSDTTVLCPHFIKTHTYICTT